MKCPQCGGSIEWGGIFYRYHFTKPDPMPEFVCVDCEVPHPFTMKVIDDVLAKAKALLESQGGKWS